MTPPDNLWAPAIKIFKEEPILQVFHEQKHFV